MPIESLAWGVCNVCMELKSKSFKIERIGLKPPLGKPSNKFDNVKTWTRGSFLFLIVQYRLLANEKNKLR